MIEKPCNFIRLSDDKQDEIKAINIPMMCKTSDNWCPNFPNDEVKVSLHLKHPLTDDPPMRNWPIRISVWGNDDLGMEKIYETSDEGKRKAITEFAELLNMIIGMDDLHDRGFEVF